MLPDELKFPEFALPTIVQVSIKEERLQEFMKATNCDRENAIQNIHKLFKWAVTEKINGRTLCSSDENGNVRRVDL